MFVKGVYVDQVNFYANSTNSCTLIDVFLSSVSGQTHKLITYEMQQ